MGSLLRDIILTYVVALSVSMDAPVSRRLKAKRLGEGGTQTFDIYIICNIIKKSRGNL